MVAVTVINRVCFRLHEEVGHAFVTVANCLLLESIPHVVKDLYSGFKAEGVAYSRGSGPCVASLWRIHRRDIISLRESKDREGLCGPVSLRVHL